MEVGTYMVTYKMGSHEPLTRLKFSTIQWTEKLILYNIVTIPISVNTCLYTKYSRKRGFQRFVELLFAELAYIHFETL